MCNYWSSLAIAQCEFSFVGLPTFSASFSESASNKKKENAIVHSKKAVLETIEKYINSQPCLLEIKIKINYETKEVMKKPCGCNDNKNKKPCGCHDNKNKKPCGCHNKKS
jgi:hypothetical protein